MSADVLSVRALNRATLARQLLLDRADRGIEQAVTQLVGLQAQKPNDPYLALWSRIAGFDPHELGRLIEARALVRIVVMRGTIHLVTTPDAFTLRPLMQPVLDAEIERHRDFAPHLLGVDIREALAFARDLMATRPRTGAQLRGALAEAFPDLDAASVAYACRCRLPLVQVPPRGVWGKTAQVTLAPLDTWAAAGSTAVPRTARSSIADAVLRYLNAFGPATVADVTAWCRLTGIREVLERVRPRLRTFTNERGQELFDIPDAPRPDPETPAPVRFLPEYDNALLSFADRTRFAPPHQESVTGRSFDSGAAAVLIDGAVQAMWSSTPDKGSGHAVLTVDPFGDLSRRVRAEVEVEAHATATFWHHGATTCEVRFRIPDRQ